MVDCEPTVGGELWAVARVVVDCEPWVLEGVVVDCEPTVGGELWAVAGVVVDCEPWVRVFAGRIYPLAHEAHQH